MTVVTWNAHEDREGFVTPSENVASGSTGLRLNAHSGPMALNHDGTVTGMGPQRFDAGELITDRGGYTITSKAGLPVGNREPRPDDVVTVNGMQTSYAVAVRTGLIAPDGRLTDITSPAETNETTAERDGTEALPEAAETLVGELLQATRGDTQIRAVVDVVDREGVVSQGTINALASEAGITPAEMAGKVSAVVEAFQAQADGVVTRYASDASAVYEWARQNDPQGLKAAMRQLATERTTQGFDALGRRYFETADVHSPELVEALPWPEGVRVERAPNGALIVRGPNGSEGWRTLARSGRLADYLQGGASAPNSRSVSADWVELPGGRWFNTSTTEVASAPR